MWPEVICLRFVGCLPSTAKRALRTESKSARPSMVRIRRVLNDRISSPEALSDK